MESELIAILKASKKFLRQRMEMGEEELFFKEPNKMLKPLESLYNSVKDCQKCELHKMRTNVVFGEGNKDAGLMFVGEAPGEEEDRQGRPFVGRAGKLLTKIIEAIRFKREEVYIGNILKCRPPDNRDPLPVEVKTCKPYLNQQIEIINPKIICALGRVAGQNLLERKASLSKLRNKVHSYKNRKVIVTYHPAALLRNPKFKRDTWEDMKFLRREYDGTVIE